MQTRLNEPPQQVQSSQGSNPLRPKGYIPVPRALFDHPFWTEEVEFSPREALVDLYRLARTLPTATLEVGQFDQSVAELAERWRWTHPRTKRFLLARIAEGWLSCQEGVWSLVENPNKMRTRSSDVNAGVNPKPATDVGLTPLDVRGDVTETLISEQKKESTKERKASEFRFEESKRSFFEDSYRPEQDGARSDSQKNASGGVYGKRERDRFETWAERRERRRNEVKAEVYRRLGLAPGEDV
jgi:hypothetical protein